MDSGARISADLRKAPWSEELRATLSLAWPLILANVTQQAIQAEVEKAHRRFIPIAS